MIQTPPTNDLNESIRREEIKRAAEGMKDAIKRLDAARQATTATRERIEAERTIPTTEAIAALDDLDHELRELKKDLLRQILPPSPPATMTAGAPPEPPSGRSAPGSDNSTPQAKESPLWGIAPAGGA